MRKYMTNFSKFYRKTRSIQSSLVRSGNPSCLSCGTDGGPSRDGQNDAGEGRGHRVQHHVLLGQLRRHQQQVEGRQREDRQDSLRNGSLLLALHHLHRWDRHDRIAAGDGERARGLAPSEEPTADRDGRVRDRGYRKTRSRHRGHEFPLGTGWGVASSLRAAHLHPSPVPGRSSGPHPQRVQGPEAGRRTRFGRDRAGPRGLFGLRHQRDLP